MRKENRSTRDLIMASRVERENNLEIFSLIYLDSSNDPKEIQRIEKKFRLIFNHFLRFETIESCRDYLGKTTSNDRLILITSGRLGSEFVPTIDKSRQILSIYIFCLDKPANEQWSRQYSKVKPSFSSLFTIPLIPIGQRCFH